MKLSLKINLYLKFSLKNLIIYIPPDFLNVASSAASACVKLCRTGVIILPRPYTFQRIGPWPILS